MGDLRGSECPRCGDRVDRGHVCPIKCDDPLTECTARELRGCACLMADRAERRARFQKAGV